MRFLPPVRKSIPPPKAENRPPVIPPSVAFFFFAVVDFFPFLLLFSSFASLSPALLLVSVVVSCIDYIGVCSLLGSRVDSSHSKSGLRGDGSYSKGSVLVTLIVI